jgi:hypothetical protein
MRSDPLTRAVSRISEAALAPDRWPAALQSITEAVGALGVGYLLLKKRTGGVEWVSMAGLSVDVNDYINYYAAWDLIPASIPAAERLQNSVEADTSASATPRISIL